MDSELNKLRQECMFSGERADSDEHVIPSWLQRRIGLWGQDVVLPIRRHSAMRERQLGSHEFAQQLFKSGNQQMRGIACYSMTSARFQKLGHLLSQKMSAVTKG